MSAEGSLVSINRSNGGVPKLRVERCRVTRNGLEGDRQRDLRYHGGPDRAVTLYSLERIQALRAEGHPIEPGGIGENLTVSGLDWEALVPGARLSVGGAELELTRYASPCQTIAGCFVERDFTRVSQKLHPGWSRLYARVLEEGFVAIGDDVALVS